MRTLVRRRWGTRRLDAMLAELTERRDELGTPQRAALRALLTDDRTTRR
jgi:hypothetical protein